MVALFFYERRRIQDVRRLGQRRRGTRRRPSGLALREAFQQDFETSSARAALCVLLIGIINAIKTSDMLCAIVSVVFGALMGEALKIEQRLDGLGDRAEEVCGGGRQPLFGGVRGATLLFCVGAMAVVGSLQAGLTGDRKYACCQIHAGRVSSVIFASAMGLA
jgi:uncharacterized membrane protein YqgA involved in biofilm formation